MVAIQLEFGLSHEECEFKALHKEIAQVQSSCDKVRRKLFAENTETKECVKTLIFLVTDLIKRVEIIEKGICNG